MGLSLCTNKFEIIERNSEQKVKSFAQNARACARNFSSKMSNKRVSMRVLVAQMLTLLENVRAKSGALVYEILVQAQKKNFKNLLYLQKYQ